MLRSLLRGNHRRVSSKLQYFHDVLLLPMAVNALVVPNSILSNCTLLSLVIESELVGETGARLGSGVGTGLVDGQWGPDDSVQGTHPLGDEQVLLLLALLLRFHSFIFVLFILG